jgi:hypothetical protein
MSHPERQGAIEKLIKDSLIKSVTPAKAGVQVFESTGFRRSPE